MTTPVDERTGQVDLPEVIEEEDEEAQAPIPMRFSTPQEAAYAASNIFNPISIQEDAEVLGGIIEDNDGNYYFSWHKAEAGKDEPEFRIKRPKSHKLVGLWHTHGSSGFARHVFSNKDLMAVRKKGIPLYLADPEGNFRVLNPGARGERTRLYDPKIGKKRLVTMISPGEPVMGPGGQPLSVRSMADEQLVLPKNPLVLAQN